MQLHPAHKEGCSMNPNDELSLKNDAFKWAAWEYEHDPGYWQDRAKNGSGLIQQIASFVLQHSQGVQG